MSPYRETAGWAVGAVWSLAAGVTAAQATPIYADQIDGLLGLAVFAGIGAVAGVARLCYAVSVQRALPPWPRPMMGLIAAGFAGFVAGALVQGRVGSFPDQVALVSIVAFASDAVLAGLLMGVKRARLGDSLASVIRAVGTTLLRVSPRNGGEDDDS